MKKAILYARFSPRPDAEECESCESQLKELREYCSKRGYEVAGEFSDQALSGGDDWEERPGMFDAAKAVKKGYLFIVVRLDRLFRDTMKALVFKSMIEAKGVTVRSTTEPAANGDESGDDALSDLVGTILLAIAQYQRQVIKARTRAKMLQHQANGRRMSGEPPYGRRVCDHDAKRLEKDYDEIATIDTIVTARRAGDSLRAIARLLNHKKIFNRAGKPWHHEQVKRILIREGEHEIPSRADEMVP